MAGGASDAPVSGGSAVCTIPAVLLIGTVDCLRNGTSFELPDVDGRPITPAEQRATVAEHYQIAPEIRAGHCAASNARSRARPTQRTQQGVAWRCKVTPGPIPA